MRLLNRTVTNYLLFSGLLVLLSTPVFYFTVQHLFVRAMDEELKAHKAEFEEVAQDLKTGDDLRLYMVMNNEVQLINTLHTPTRDSIYSDQSYDSTLNKEVPHRILRSGLNINGKAYELVIKESMVSNTSLVGAIVMVQLALLLVLMVGLYLINKRLARTVWTPFYDILERLKRYRIDQQKTIDLPFPPTAEFRELSTAIKQLVNRNHDLYLRQKEFTENAAHELQTPLAISRSKLELLAQTSELTQEQAELVGHLLDATDRLTRLNKNLLLLTQIENSQFEAEEEIDLKVILEKFLPMYHRQAEERGIILSTSINDNIQLRGRRSLMEILLNNLLTNAIRYTRAGGEVQLAVHQHEVTVQNTGDPLKCPDKIFERFYRDSRSGQGSGLGLSIVKKICDSQGYVITYAYRGGYHVFQVKFQ